MCAVRQKLCITWRQYGTHCCYQTRHRSKAWDACGMWAVQTSPAMPHRTATAGWSDKATGNPPPCLSTLTTMPNGTSLGNEPVWRMASSVSDPKCLWSGIATLPGQRRGVWCSWVALAGGTCHQQQGDDPVLQQPNPPLLSGTRYKLLPWLCLRTLRDLSNRKASPFFSLLVVG